MSDIREKIKNLLDLASSDNEYEAKAAFLKAQELMVKHKLSERDIDCLKEKKVKSINTGLKYSSRTDTFVLSLAKTIVENYCCINYANKVYGAKTRTLVIAGFEEDVEICMEVLTKAMETITMNSKKLVYRKGYTAKEKKIIIKSYADGFVKGLKEMFLKQRKINEEEWGLVLVTPNEVKEILNNCKTMNLINHFNDRNESAFNKGKKDGESFNPGKKHGIGSSTLAITG